MYDVGEVQMSRMVPGLVGAAAVAGRRRRCGHLKRTTGAIPGATPSSAALVTGASSGIGAQLARGLARRGHNVILVARRRERLDTLAIELRKLGVRVEVLACDLGDAAAREQLERDVAALELKVTVLCNNAGLGTAGSLKDWDVDRELQVFRVNAEAPADLCARFGLAMARDGSGAILNVCSLASFLPLPRQAAYSASKAAALAFSDVIRVDLRRFGVTVTAVCPGTVETEFPEKSDLGHLERKAPKFIFDDPGMVAESSLRALDRGRRMVVPGVKYGPVGFAMRVTPRRAALELLDKIWPAGK